MIVSALQFPPAQCAQRLAGLGSLVRAIFV